jgi:hypothetical protein
LIESGLICRLLEAKRFNHGRDGRVTLECTQEGKVLLALGTPDEQGLDDYHLKKRNGLFAR